MFPPRPVRIAACVSGKKRKGAIIMISVICLFAGAAVGFFTASMCMAARRGDRMRPDGADPGDAYAGHGNIR